MVLFIQEARIPRLLLGVFHRGRDNKEIMICFCVCFLLFDFRRINVFVSIVIKRSCDSEKRKEC